MVVPVLFEEWLYRLAQLIKCGMAISAVMGVDHCRLLGCGIAAILPENAIFVKVRYERCFIRTVLG